MIQTSKSGIFSMQRDFNTFKSQHFGIGTSIRSSVELWLKIFRVLHIILSSQVRHFSSVTRYQFFFFFFVTSCTKEVRCHLRQVKMSQTTVSTESNSILARAGLFSHDVATRTICPRHRVEMGVMWWPKTICAHPRRETRETN